MLQAMGEGTLVKPSSFLLHPGCSRVQRKAAGCPSLQEEKGASQQVGLTGLPTQISVNVRDFSYRIRKSTLFLLSPFQPLFVGGFRDGTSSLKSRSLGIKQQTWYATSIKVLALLMFKSGFDIQAALSPVCWLKSGLHSSLCSIHTRPYNI